MAGRPDDDPPAVRAAHPAAAGAPTTRSGVYVACVAATAITVMIIAMLLAAR